MKYFYLYFLAIIALSSCSLQRQLLVEEKTFKLGDTEIDILRYENGEGPLFYNMHDDENTSFKAALKYLKIHGGSMVVLSHTGERNIKFNYRDTIRTFDPNRIYTDQGIRKTLTKFNCYGPEVHRAIRIFSDTVLQTINFEAMDKIFALHNNTNKRYSIKDYIKGGRFENEAADAVYVQGSDEDDFYYITNRRLYRILKEAGENVIVQDNRRATDDGSLSVLCGQQGKFYVNVEAQHGHKRKQYDMYVVLKKALEAVEIKYQK